MRVALRTAFFAPPFFLREDDFFAVFLRAVVLRAAFFRVVFLRVVFLRADDFFAVFLRAVVLRAATLRVLFLRVDFFFDAAFLAAIGMRTVPFRVRGLTTDARRPAATAGCWLPTLYHSAANRATFVQGMRRAASTFARRADTAHALPMR